MLLTRPAVLGALCWLVAGPLLLAAHLLAALGWHDPRYDWAADTIGDLGNVHCGVWDTARPRDVCSPWHGSMNAAVVLTGLLLAAGILVGWRGAVARGAAARAAQSLVLLAAAGYVLAGAFPADVDGRLHLPGELLVLLVGNLGLLVAGLAARGRVRAWTLAAATVAIAAALLFFDGQAMGIGVGSMQRLAVLPLPLWACCVGTGLLAGHLNALADDLSAGDVGQRYLADPAHGPSLVDGSHRGPQPALVCGLNHRFVDGRVSALGASSLEAGLAPGPAPAASSFATPKEDDSSRGA